MWLLYLIVALLTLWGLLWAIERILKIPIELNEKKRVEELARETEQRETVLKHDRERLEAMKAEAATALEMISKEKALGFPWLATAYSEYRKLYELKLAETLETKRPPAKRAAEVIRTMAIEKTQLRRENRILRELHRYYENLFPWLIEFKGEDLDELIRQVNEPGPDEAPDDDPAARWLSGAERDSPKLTRAEKFQRALDRWWQSKKSPWQLGCDYERYVGYLHEQDGFKVAYHGIELGYEDLGRDLICSRGREVRVVQCKYWSGWRTVREKHVCQVFGTAAAYRIKLGHQGELFGEREVTPWLYISCTASPTAKEFADMLGVKLIDDVPLERYPIIKCNISMRDGAKIYHLPFDQQYDRTLIEYRDECYVATISEAEALGFRRAYRWRGGRLEQK